MSRPFGYEGKPGTCLWCGRRIKEWAWDVGPWEIERGHQTMPVVGELFRGRKVARVVPSIRVGRRVREIQPGEEPDRLRVFFDPPRWEAAYYADDPMFDTIGCAAQFGARFAQLGKRLESKP